MQLIISLISYLGVSHAVKNENQETLQHKNDFKIINLYNIQTN